jgi:hypothetical protein
VDVIADSSGRGKPAWAGLTNPRPGIIVNSLNAIVELAFGSQEGSILSHEGGTMPMKRTTHRSSKGTKLYAVRDSKGRFVDIQTYKRAHSADMKRKSKAEIAKKP